MHSISSKENTQLSDEIPEADAQKFSLKATMDKVMIAQQQLRNFEKLLLNKEEILDDRSQKLAHATELLSHKEMVYESRMKDLSLKEAEFAEELKSFSLEKEKFTQKALELDRLRALTEENYKKSESMRLQHIEEQKLIVKAQEKIKLENKILMEQIQSLSLKRNDFEKIQEGLDKNKRINEEEAIKLAHEREMIQNLKDKLNEERELLRSEIKKAEGLRRRCEEKANGSEPRQSLVGISDINVLIETLQSQIAVFNKEISYREAVLLEKEQKLVADQQNFLKSLGAQREIEHSLKNTKEELVKLQSEIVPDLENMHQVLLNMIQDVSGAMKSSEQKVRNIEHDIALINEIKELTAAQQERIDKKIEDITMKEEKLYEMSVAFEERQSNMSFTSDSSKVESVLSELENNLRLLREKQIEVDKEAEENSKTAEYLKNSIKEIEESKVYLLKERIKIKEKNHIIESKYKKMIEKQLELEQFRRTLDTKDLDLKFKQKELSILKLQNSDRSSTSLIDS